MCPECGAPTVDGLDCWGQLGLVIAWEATDAELFAVHFHTVASYNLQHPAQYTDEAIAGLKTTLEDVLDHDLPIAEVRRRMSGHFDGPRRVKRDPADQRPVLVAWPMTIADVTGPGPTGASERVKAWAAAIRSTL